MSLEPGIVSGKDKTPDKKAERMSITQTVMGFSFEEDLAKVFRSQDLIMRILADLQRQGVAVIDEGIYTTLPSQFRDWDDYWSVFHGPNNTIALICDSFEPVWIC